MPERLVVVGKLVDGTRGEGGFEEICDQDLAVARELTDHTAGPFVVVVWSISVFLPLLVARGDKRHV